MSPNAFDLARQTLLVVLPECLIILAATAMMTAGAFVRLPRRAWSLISLAILLAATLALFACRSVTPDP